MREMKSSVQHKEGENYEPLGEGKDLSSSKGAQKGSFAQKSASRREKRVKKGSQSPGKGKRSGHPQQRGPGTVSGRSKTVNPEARSQKKGLPSWQVEERRRRLLLRGKETLPVGGTASGGEAGSPLPEKRHFLHGRQEGVLAPRLPCHG